MSTLLDEETVVLDKLDFDVPCGVPTCEKAATHSLTCRHCGHVDLLCDACLALARRLASRSRGGVEHARCGWRAPTLDELVVVVSL